MQTLTQPSVAVNGDCDGVAHRFGLEDGLENKSMFTGYEYFAGWRLQEYLQGHAEGVAMRQWLEGVVVGEVRRLAGGSDVRPVSEEAAMDATLADLRNGRMQPIVRLSPEQLEQIESERWGAK